MVPLTRHTPQDPPKVVIQLFQLLFFLLGDGPSVLQVALVVALVVSLLGQPERLNCHWRWQR